MKKLALTLVLVSAIVATAPACSSSSETSSSSSGTTGDGGATGDSGGTTPATNNIVVKSNVFVPATLTIKAGETVTWTWQGGAHTVTSGANCTSDNAYKSGLQSTVGATFTHTYPTAGTFEFFCEPHCASSGMKGTITVQ